MDKCKFCGAKKLFTKNCYTAFDCGSRLYSKNEWYQEIGCYERQIQQSEARARDLWETLEHVVRRDGFSYGHALDTVDKHADHFRKESEATND
jgi:hypothetical protein